MDEIKMENRITSVEKLSGSNRHRIDQLENGQEALNKMAESVAVMANEQKHQTAAIGVIQTDVQELKAEPGKRWRFVVEKAIYVIVATLVGFALARFGL